MRWGFSHPRVATSQPRSPPAKQGRTRTFPGDEKARARHAGSSRMPSCLPIGHSTRQDPTPVARPRDACSQGGGSAATPHAARKHRRAERRQRAHTLCARTAAGPAEGDSLPAEEDSARHAGPRQHRARHPDLAHPSKAVPHVPRNPPVASFSEVVLDRNFKVGSLRFHGPEREMLTQFPRLNAIGEEA